MLRIISVFGGLSLLLWSVGVHAEESAASTDALLKRIAADTAMGKPMVTTVYVALCDNDSQGIIPVKNRRICNGDDPAQNMYWQGNGISGYLKMHGWKRHGRTRDDNGTVMVEEVWKKRIFAGKKMRQLGAPRSFDAVVVAKAYRGSRIHDAMKDYLSAIHADAGEVATTGDGQELNAGGQSHVVGYIGHDYFMDVAVGSDRYNELTASRHHRTARLAKGTFAFACISNAWVRPYVSYANIYILAMNNYLTYPSAWTLGGIVQGIAAGGDGEFIYRQAARQFANGQKCGLKWALKAFSYGAHMSYE